MFQFISDTTTFTVLLLDTFIVNFVSFTFVHPSGVTKFSLHVNVNNKFPLVHAASVIVHVGGVSSIIVNL